MDEDAEDGGVAKLVFKSTGLEHMLPVTNELLLFKSVLIANDEWTGIWTCSELFDGGIMPGKAVAGFNPNWAFVAIWFKLFTQWFRCPRMRWRTPWSTGSMLPKYRLTSDAHSA